MNEQREWIFQKCYRIHRIKEGSTLPSIIFNSPKITTKITIPISFFPNINSI